ncbi:MAG: universal stress protein [Chloroflexi bacterium]|nr:universal stress protein [Chloroflexota bacterium]
MFSRIVLSLDGSDISEQAIPITISLAKALSLPVTLVEVANKRSSSAIDPTRLLPVPGIQKNLEGEAANYLAETANSFRDQGVQSVREALRSGDVAGEIMKEADEGESALIVMATHGRAGVSRWTLGSVCDRIIRHSESPVLAIRAHSEEGAESPPSDVTRLVVPLDGSELGEQILPVVTDLARSLNVPVALIQVGEVADLNKGYWPDDADDARKLDEDAKAYLEHQAARLSALGVISVEVVMLHGDKADKILSFAAEKTGTLLAMTTHGRSGVARWALGGVADRVIRHSECPTLVIRAKIAEEKHG